MHGEYWNAVAGEPIEIGERVQVIGVNGMRLTVRRVASTSVETRPS